jgi:hypothetical protein
MGPQVATGDRNLLCRAKISPENPVICNQQVVGSSPTAGSLLSHSTKAIKKLIISPRSRSWDV